MALILILKVLEPVLSLGDTPLPLSTTSAVTVAVPLALALGVKVRVPLEAMVGCTSKSPELLFDKLKVKVCPSSP